MEIRLAVAVAASCVGLGACTTAGGTPATAPDVTTTIMTTTEPGATTTADQPATTTTLDRIAEIEAIFQDLEVRRLQAIMDQDEDAFRAVFANDEYAERSMAVFDVAKVLDPTMVTLEVKEVFSDTAVCIAVGAVVDTTGAIEGGGLDTQDDNVIEFSGDQWAISWIGSGWRCDGPHPFSD